MAHDTHALHVSHYKGSATWRTSVSPTDGSWLLFVDAGGSPHLYLATETRTAEGETVTTYAPCVRAMLRADAEAGRMPHGEDPLKDPAVAALAL